MINSSPILLVDDDSTDAILFERALDKLEIGNPLVRLTDCKAALEYLSNQENKKPWLIFTDLNTPEMNGIEFLRAVKADEALKHIIVIILSGSGNESDVAESYKLGVAGYMVKPSDYKKLVEIIGTTIAYWTICELPQAIITSKSNCSYPLQ
jgi:CheY-like chemotaxis protein